VLVVSFVCIPGMLFGSRLYFVVSFGNEIRSPDRSLRKKPSDPFDWLTKLPIQHCFILILCGLPHHVFALLCFQHVVFASPFPVVVRSRSFNWRLGITVNLIG
jgi:hypothetical protein